MKHLQNIVFLLVLVVLMIAIGILPASIAQDEDMSIYISADESLSFPYPSTWEVFESADGVNITTGFAPEESDRPLEDGEMMVSIADPQLLSQLGLATTAPPQDVLDVMLPIFENLGWTHDEPEPIMIGRNPPTPALLIEGTDNYGNDIAFVVIGFPAGTILVQAIGATGNLAGNSPAFDIIFNISYVERAPIEVANLQPINLDNAESIDSLVEFFDSDFFFGYGAGFMTPSTIAVTNEIVADGEFFVMLQVIDLETQNIVDLVNFNDVFNEFENNEWVSNVNAIPASNQIITSHDDGAVRWWDATTGELLNTLDTGFQRARDLVISADGTVLAVETNSIIDGVGMTMVTIIDLTTNEIVGSVPDGTSSTGRFNDGDHALNADGTMLIVSGAEGIYIYDTSDLAETEPAITSDVEFYPPIALSPDGNALAIQDINDAIHFYDLNTLEIVTSIDDPYASLIFPPIEAMAFTSDGSVLVVADDAGFALVDASTGEAIRRVEQSLEGDGTAGINMNIFTMSPDGTTIIYAGYQILTAWGISGG